jgi:hypothetical protein
MREPTTTPTEFWVDDQLKIAVTVSTPRRS